jgi:hypothetical protein
MAILLCNLGLESIDLDGVVGYLELQGCYRNNMDIDLGLKVSFLASELRDLVLESSLLVSKHDDLAGIGFYLGPQVSKLVLNHILVEGLVSLLAFK